MTTDTQDLDFSKVHIEQHCVNISAPGRPAHLVLSSATHTGRLPAWAVPGGEILALPTAPTPPHVSEEPAADLEFEFRAAS